MVVSALTLLVTMGHGAGAVEPFEALARLDNDDLSYEQREEALRELELLAPGNPLICVELARRIGHSAVLTPQVFAGPGAACHPYIVPTIETILGSNDKPLGLYNRLEEDEYLENPEFVRRMLRRFPAEEALGIVQGLAYHELGEYGGEVAEVVLAYGKTAPTNVLQIGHNLYAPWEFACAAWLLRLRDEGNKESVDKALRQLWQAMQSQQYEESLQESSFWGEDEDLREQMRLVLADGGTDTDR